MYSNNKLVCVCVFRFSLKKQKKELVVMIIINNNLEN